MYEQQKPFSLGLLATISSFLNSFIFHVIWHGLIGSLTFSFVPFLPHSLALRYASQHIPTWSLSVEIGTVAAGRASGIKVP